MERPEFSAIPAAARAEVARSTVKSGREQLARGEAVDWEALAAAAAQQFLNPSLRPVINMTGIVLHTGLGRARLAPAAVEAVHRAAAEHTNLEFDLAGGERGDRQAHVRALLTGLTGAEDAHVVNNAAGATVLALAATARGLGVALSRGEMVEIGGSFRLPDILVQSGAQLVEVGTTNRTRLSDYEAALQSGAQVLLRCHPSNYRIVGFQESPTREQLAHLADRYGAVYIDDQGSGGLVDLSTLGWPANETLTDSITAGAHLCLASADKLLGGPQAGLVLGRAELIDKVRRHPLARALRIDKLSLAALEATLRLYRDGRARQEVPTLRYLARPIEELQEIGARIAQGVSGVAVEASEAQVGAGSVPGETRPSRAIRIPDESAAATLRQESPPIVGRVHAGATWLDVRCVEAAEEPLVRQALLGWIAS